MNNRRKLVIVLGATASLPQAVFAQAKKPPVVIGFLHSATASERTVAAFKEGMAAHGWRDGVTYVLEVRMAQGNIERLPALIQELVAKKPAVIVAAVGATVAAAKAAPNIPIVQALGGSPVDWGLAASLARPGGMVTGVTNIPTELSAKYLELLLAADPKIKRVGFLVDAKSTIYDRFMKHAQRGIDHYRIDARIALVHERDELDAKLTQLAKEEIQGLVIGPTGGLFTAKPERERIVKFALAQRWPVVAGPRVFVEAGALLSYSADTAAQYRRAAYFVDRILKGAKPGDLPIEQPMTFDLVVNQTTAKALGLPLSPEITVRATQLIQ
jgi:putative ABC transport system substrate-binding protein